MCANDSSERFRTTSLPGKPERQVQTRPDGLEFELHLTPYVYKINRLCVKYKHPDYIRCNGGTCSRPVLSLDLRSLDGVTRCHGNWMREVAVVVQLDSLDAFRPGPVNRPEWRLLLLAKTSLAVLKDYIGRTERNTGPLFLGNIRLQLLYLPHPDWVLIVCLFQIAPFTIGSDRN